jgi:hypothetical protein
VTCPPDDKIGESKVMEIAPASSNATSPPERGGNSMPTERLLGLIVPLPLRPVKEKAVDKDLTVF